MDIIQTIESAAHSAVEAVEHPFHTIGARLTAIGEHIRVFLGHPYAAPPLADALTALHGVVTDLAQEVAELRVPCPCKPASTSSSTVATGDAGQASASTSAGHGDAAPEAHADANAAQAIMSAADLSDFMRWKAERAALQPGA